MRRLLRHRLGPSARRLLLLLSPLLAGLVSCARARPPAHRDGADAFAAPVAALALPDVIDGFAAGPTTRGAGFVRRTYARGLTVLSVTMARLPMSPDEYASWTRTSVASFPQAELDAPADDANGFYQCTENMPPRCALLIQLRSGLHVEIRGDGAASHEDVDTVARALPLRALAASGTGP